MIVILLLLSFFWRSWGAFWVPLDTTLVIQGSLGTALESRYGLFLIFDGFQDFLETPFGSLSAPVFMKNGVGNGADFLTRFLLISGVIWRGLDPENPSKTRDGTLLRKVTLGSDFLQF